MDFILAIYVIKRNRIIRSLKNVGAIDAEHAVSLEQMGLSNSKIFNQLIRKGKIIKTPGGLYYYINKRKPYINLP